MRNVIISMAAALLLLSSTAIPAAGPQWEHPASLFTPKIATAPGQLIIKFRSSPTATGITDNEVYAPDSRLAGILARHRLLKLNRVFTPRSGPRFALATTAAAAAQSSGLDRMTVAQVPVEEVNNTLLDLRAETGVEYAEPVYIMHTFNGSSGVPNDPYYAETGTWGQSYADLWGINRIYAPEAWPMSTGQGVLVAVVDTGADTTHPDLAANLNTTNSWNYLSNSSNITDDNGHGTHVSGTIAAVGNNGLGVIGVAYQAQILPIKFLDANGSGSSADGASAIEYAAEHGAKVISNSWGGPYSQAITDAVTFAHNMGAVVIAAAGNSSSNANLYSPAGAPYAITVSATDPSDKFASFSNFGSKIDVAAPGVDVLSLLAANSTFAQTQTANIVGGNYLRLSGTSMATPHVAGVAALLLAEYPNLTPEQVRYLIQSGAQSLDPLGRDNYTGYGMINAATSLQYASWGYAPNVEGALTTQFQSELQTGTVAITGDANGPQFDHYELAYGLDQPGSSFTTFNSSTIAISAGTLGNLTTKTLPAGKYLLRLRVYATNSRYIDYYDQFVADNTLKPGWPKNLPIAFNGGDQGQELSPTLADLDGTGKRTVILPTSTSLYAYDSAGNLRSGFPYTPSIGDISGSVSTADLFADGNTELVFPTSVVYSNTSYSVPTIYALKANGQPLPGFPVNALPASLPPSPYGIFINGRVSIADIDGDGRPDLVYVGCVGSSTLAQKTVFVNALDSSGKEKPGFPVTVAQAEISVAAPDSGYMAIGDLNNDGFPEIVVGTQTALNQMQLTILNHDGTLLRTIDVSSQLALFHDPIIADINGDGVPEIILVGVNQNNYLTATAITPTGAILPGWPVVLDNTPFPVNGYWPEHPFTVTDLNGDGKLELVVGHQGRLHALAANGTELAGWPKTSYGQDYSGVNISTAQLNGSATLLFSVDGYMWQVNNQGNALPGWPKPEAIYGWTGPAVADIDNNGLPDVVANAPLAYGVAGSDILAWEQGGTASTGGCQQYRCNNQRTGYVTPTVVNSAKTYATVYLRGTNNSWGTTSMALIANHRWAVTVPFLKGTGDAFKFDIYGNWSLNYGGSAASGTGVSSGGNIPVTQGAGNYYVTFNDQTLAYTSTLVGPVHVPPVANAGSAQTIVAATPTSVSLSGMASSDSDGTINSYTWDELINGVWEPVATGVSPTLSNVSVAVHTYQLTVTDNFGASSSAQVVVTISNGYSHVYNQMYLRGTNNAWGTTAMTLTANNTWQTKATFAAGGAYKFDVNGDWSLNFGAGSGNIGVQGGPNIAVSAAGTYSITFNDKTHLYTATLQ